MNRPDFTKRAYPVAEVIDVYDGDSYKLLLDVGGSIGWWPWLRLDGFSCPELRVKGDFGHMVDNPAGVKAREAARILIGAAMEAELLWVVTHRAPHPYKVKRYQDEDQTFSRYVADVMLGDVLLGDQLVASGDARVGAFQG